MTTSGRLLASFLGLQLLFGLVILRLFYWQVVKGQTLRSEAQGQYQRSITLQGSRGSLVTADGHLLVGNEKVYRFFAEPPLITQDHQQLVDSLVPLVANDITELKEATEEAKRKEIVSTTTNTFLERLSKPEAKWVGLLAQVSEETKGNIEALGITGLGFEPYEVRYYPEASMAAHLTGFVGKDSEGNETGYFGVEGALNKELQPKAVKHTFENGILGFSLGSSSKSARNGRDVHLSVRRDVQFLVEQALAEGVERYGAASGEVIVLEPSTGRVIAQASLPKYDQKTFHTYDQTLYRNPSVSAIYEPGSTLKVITAALGIEHEVITPDTKCPNCDGPRTIASYTLRTWNNEYNPDISMTDALAKSDNVAMIFIQEQLSTEQFKDGLADFGIGQRTSIDLQEDTDSPFPSRWGPVEKATISFGQGIGTTSLQLVRAVNAIANQGLLVQPQVVTGVIDPVTGKLIPAAQPKPRRVVSAETAHQVTQMMVHAANGGEAQWTASKKYDVAGKTGTAQIAVDGTYDPNKTIASFIGFSPPEQPKFTMLVKLTEPTSSPWAAETAAPLWYEIADQLQLLLSSSEN